MDQQELAAAVQLLAKLEPGYLPFDIFHQVARLTVLPVVELVPLRLDQQGEVEVLLLDRDPDDPIFPGQIHTPGTVVRATDIQGSFESAFDRLLHDELRDVQLSEPAYVYHLFHHSGRGTESSHIYRAEVLGEPTAGTFYKINNLPATLMKSQLEFILRAANDYSAS